MIRGTNFKHPGFKSEKAIIQLLSFSRYGVHDMDVSARSICRAAHGTPEDHVAIILAHNGPTGGISTYEAFLLV